MQHSTESYPTRGHRNAEPTHSELGSCIRRASANLCPAQYTLRCHIQAEETGRFLRLIYLKYFLSFVSVLFYKPVREVTESSGKSGQQSRKLKENVHCLLDRAFGLLLKRFMEKNGLNWNEHSASRETATLASEDKSSWETSLVGFKKV